MIRFLPLTITIFFLFSFVATNAQNPTVTINQAAAQPDPTNTAPINFTAVFDQPVTGFTTGDVIITGTTGANVAVVTGGPFTYNVTVVGMTSCGTVIVNIPAGVCTNTLTQPNLASTSTDNTVTFGGLPAIVNVTPITSCGGVAGSGGPCTPLTASGNADTYIWSPLAGLYTDCAHTIPYTGTNAATVYAAPTAHTIYTVTGTNIASGCINFTTTAVNYTPPAPVITPASVNMCLGDPPVKLKVTAGIPARPAIWSPIAGLFADPACTIPYVGIPVDSVWARPTPAGVYTYQATTTSIPGPPRAATNPAAITIPVGGAATLYPSSMFISGLPATGVKVSSVVLHGVNHTKSEDIDVLLQSPSGQNVILMSDVGGANAINATYTFMDWAPYMSSAAANLTGTYSPTNSGTADNFPTPGPGNISNSALLNSFTGNYNGTWKLFVFDDDGTSDQGVISGGYTINFDTIPACTSPARTVVITVGQAATINTQPANQTRCVSGVAVFSVGVTSAGPVSYQWQLSVNGGTTYTNITNGGPFSGVNTATLTINPVTTGMNGYFFRVVVSGCSQLISSAALLTVGTIPNVVITANPLIIGPTQTSTITSVVTPNPPTTYTWYYNNAVIPGAISSSLVVNYGSPGDYQLKVTDANNCGVGVSNIETIANSFASNLYAYPNPSGGVFQMRYPNEPNTVSYRFLLVYNNRGEKILNIPFTQTIPYQKIDVDISKHGPGLYWVELRNNIGRRVAVNKVVVQ